MIMAGHANQKFVAYPICPAARAQGRSIVNWVAELCVGGEVSPTKRNWNRQVHRDVFAAAFREWRFDWLDIPGLIEAAETIFEFPMVDRNPLPRWTFGRVTLLGDAAHPMYPIGSNGASQAILDAAALRRAVELSSDIREALCSYETQRLGPTAAIVHSNRQQGPEVVMQMAEERAPGGFRHIEDVIAPEELREISERYKRIAGFDQTTLQSLQEDRNRSCSRS
jgi:2-polyprenyl-6-methoxyphenol hydroxylase-like FAD-dependent oxidoreductase